MKIIEGTSLCWIVWAQTRTSNDLSTSQLLLLWAAVVSCCFFLLAFLCFLVAWLYGCLFLKLVGGFLVGACLVACIASQFWLQLDSMAIGDWLLLVVVVVVVVVVVLIVVVCLLN